MMLKKPSEATARNSAKLTNRLGSHFTGTTTLSDRNSKSRGYKCYPISALH